MERVLSDVNAVAGVGGCFFCGQQGAVIASATKATPDAVAFHGVGRQVAFAWAALEAAGQATEELCFCYERARIVARVLGNVALVVLCGPRVELASLRIILDTAAGLIKGDPDVRRSLAARAGERADLLAEGHLDASSRRLLGALDSRREQ